MNVMVSGKDEIPDPLDLDRVRIDPRWAFSIPLNLAKRRRMLPFTIEDGHVLVACVDPDDEAGLQAVFRYTGAPVYGVAAVPETLQRKIDQVFRFDGATAPQPSLPVRIALADSLADDEVESTDIVGLGDELIHAAIVAQATDIHIVPMADAVSVRFRVDGVLQDYRTIPAAVHSSLISRFKVMAGMDIAERRAPQDGRFSVPVDEESTYDVRAATIPTRHGERMTMRLLAGRTGRLSLDELGMEPDDRRVFEKILDSPNGLVLLTGPTGCGKSTTLYAAIRHILDKRPLNIITIEDPVEYLVSGISQVEVDTADKVSFHKALRSALRHDPDVLMIGEIRDETTAEIAVKAALTGHLVFSTLHTTSAANTATRLCDMGIRPWLTAAVSRLYVAQRLVRRLCSVCREPTTLASAEAALLGDTSLTGRQVWLPRGCRFCAGSGFAGRTGLFEMMTVDSRQADPESGDSELPTERNIGQLVSRTLREDAVHKLLRGDTSVEEILAVIDVV